MNILKIYQPQRQITVDRKNRHGVLVLTKEYGKINVSPGITETRDTGFYEFQCPTCSGIFWTDGNQRKLKGCDKCFPFAPPKTSSAITIGSERNGMIVTDIQGTTVEVVCSCGEIFMTKFYKLKLNLVTGCHQCKPDEWKKKSFKGKKTLVGFYLPSELFEALGELCHRKRKTKTALMTECVTEALKTEGLFPNS